MPGPETTRAFAPAKINLTLHVTGQRPDGYHLLDSLVMLTDVGDHVQVQRSDRLTFTVIGPNAAGIPSDDSNLVVRAAVMLGLGADITLEKHLPAAAGIGGGSSDAAACIRALAASYDVPLPDVQALLSLGADVPVCMNNGLTRMQGIGEAISVLGEPPDWPMILVNPGVDVATGPIFSRLSRKDNAPMSGAFPLTGSQEEQIAWLLQQRNDLQEPAILTTPLVGKVLEALNEMDGCLMARMSGSGATCFAIMASDELRTLAVEHLRSAEPEWWVMPAHRCGDSFS